MSSLLKERSGVGAVICRMQVPYLTESHKKLIKTVSDRHSRLIIFLGTKNDKMSMENPYPFEFRKQMILYANESAEESFLIDDNTTIIPLPDRNGNGVWASILDSLVEAFLSNGEEAVLYGGRDSFIPSYEEGKGKFDCRELAPSDYDSGTALRKLASVEQPKYSPEAANAILWAINQLSDDSTT